MGKINTAPFREIGKPETEKEGTDVTEPEGTLLIETATEEPTMAEPKEDYNDKVARFLARKAEPENDGAEDADDPSEAEVSLFTVEEGSPTIEYDGKWLSHDLSEIAGFLKRNGPVSVDSETHEEILGLFGEIGKLLYGSYRVAREWEITTLYEELVPPDGPAETVAGEILRATGEIKFALNSGWGKGGHMAHAPETAYLKRTAGETVSRIVTEMQFASPDRLEFMVPLLYGAVIDYINGNPDLKKTPNDIDFETGEKIGKEEEKDD